jgi:hypothetical protein
MGYIIRIGLQESYTLPGGFPVTFSRTDLPMYLCRPLIRTTCIILRTSVYPPKNYGCGFGSHCKQLFSVCDFNYHAEKRVPELGT